MCDLSSKMVEVKLVSW